MDNGSRDKNYNMVPQEQAERETEKKAPPGIKCEI